MIAKNAYQICLLPNVTESLVSYGEGMDITNMLQDFTGTSLNSEDDVNIELVGDTTWMI